MGLSFTNSNDKTVTVDGYPEGSGEAAAGLHRDYNVKFNDTELEKATAAIDDYEKKKIIVL